MDNGVVNMNKQENISQGIYSGHLVHFPNQAKNVFTFIIDEAEDVELIGKGVFQRVCTTETKNE